MWFAESSRTKCASGISVASSRPFLDRDHPVVPRVHDERARAYLWREIADVQAATRTVQRGRGLGRRGAPEQVLVPGHLLRRAVREKQHAEHPAERWVRRRPPRADRCNDGLFLAVLAAEPPAARIPAVQDHAGNAVRVSCRIRDGDRSRLGDAEQRESLQARRIDDRFEIADPPVDRRVADVGVREPAASLVIADDGVPIAELLQPVAPHRALPVQLEMTEPGCDPDERRTAPVHGVGQAHAVPSRAEAHVLLHSLTVQLTVGDRETARGHAGSRGMQSIRFESVIPPRIIHHEERSCLGNDMVWLPGNFPEPGRSSLSGPIPPAVTASRHSPGRPIPRLASHSPAPIGCTLQPLQASRQPENRSSKARRNNHVPVSGSTLNRGRGGPGPGRAPRQWPGSRTRDCHRLGPRRRGPP